VQYPRRQSSAYSVQMRTFTNLVPGTAEEFTLHLKMKVCELEKVS
jgi:hypothetical protein